MSVWNGVGLQHLEVSDEGWTVLKPHVPATARTIQRANGGTNWLPIVSTGVSERFLLDIDAGGNVLSLGYLGSGELPANTNGWQPGWVLSRDAYKRRNSNSVARYGIPSVAYATTTTVDPSSIYLGVFIVGAVSAGLARAKKTIGWVWKLDNSGEMYFVEGDCGSVCWGLGPSAGVGVGFLTGFSNANEIKGFTQFEAGLEVTAGAASFNNLKNLVQNSTLLGKLAPAVKVLMAAEKGLKLGKDSHLIKYQALYEIFKGHGSVKSHADALVQASNFAREAGITSVARDAGKVLSGVEIARLLLSCFGVDGSKKALSCVMATGGAELSLHAGYNTISNVSKI